MKKLLFIAISCFSINSLAAQNFYIGLGGTFVSSTFESEKINSELSGIKDVNIKDLDDIKYDNWGVSAKVRLKITDKIGANLGYSYIFSKKKNIPLSADATVTIPVINQTITQPVSTELPTNISANNYSFDLSYSFLNNKLFDIFALAGVDYSEGKISIDYPVEAQAIISNSPKLKEYTDSVTGINFGGGLTTAIGIFFEVKSKIDFTQYQATLGYLYKF